MADNDDRYQRGRDVILRVWGEQVRDFIDRRLTLVTTGVAVGIIGGFLALKLL